MRHTTKKLIILVLLLLSPYILVAQEGTVLLIKGKIKLIHEGTSTLYNTPGEEILLYEGDKIHSDRDTQATVFLRENTEEILLYSNTFFVVSKVEANKSIVNLWLGKAKFLVKPLIYLVSKERQKREFVVKTSLSTIGVKGTEFVVSSDKNGVYLLTLSGIVGMKSRYFPDVEVDVTKNQVSRVTKGEKPTQPIEVSEIERNWIIQSETGTPWFENEAELFPESSDSNAESSVDENVAEVLGDMDELLEEIQVKELDPSIKLKVVY